MSTLTARVQDEFCSSPPKATLVFRLGVVGHRWKRLEQADEQQLAERLQAVITTVKQVVCDHFRGHQDLYADTPPVVRVLSPLAEGVDRIFAEQGLAANCELTAVLPFERREFEHDFLPGDEESSVERFRQFLQRASTVFELDGCRAEELRAYHVAGTVVLNQADLLIVVWDGKRENKRGGTEETFDDALERGVPIVWIDAHAPHHWRIVLEPLRKLDEIKPGVRAALTKSHELARLQPLIRQLIELPDVPTTAATPGSYRESATHDNPHRAIRTYFQERQPHWNIGFWWKLFRDLVGDGRLKRPVLSVSPYTEAVVKDWPQDQSTPVAAMIDRLRCFYAWPDKLADRYADGYRSGFVLAFFSAAFAVAMALGPIGLELPAHSLGENLFTLAELLAISLILYLVLRARWGKWHQRWLDYRLLAEMIRHQRFIAHLGGQRATPTVPEHWIAYGDPAASWMAWQARAVERSLGLPTAVVNRAYLTECIRDLQRLLEGQIQFHDTAAARSHRIEHRLHWVEIGLFTATFMCCALHLLQGLWHAGPQLPSHWLTFCCGFFPALGAALAGICNQGEFRRITQRSRSMSSRLASQLRRLQDLEARLNQPGASPTQHSVDLANLANETAQSMVNEVLDWRVIFQDRPPRTA